MGKAAADGSAVADRRMRDVCDRLGQQRRVSGDISRFQQIDLPRQRTDHERIALDRDPAQLGELADIDDQFRRNQAQVHGRHQALAA